MSKVVKKKKKEKEYNNKFNKPKEKEGLLLHF